MNLNVSVRLDDGRKHLAEVQLNLKSVADAKHIAHEQYEVIRLALPKMCEGTSVGAGALEKYIAGRLRSSALDSAVTSLERKAGGLMLYARLIAEQLASTTGKIDFASVGALPAGLDEIYAENFRRVFVDDGAWGDALPLIELICAAAEPLTIDAASVALGWDQDRCERLCANVSLLFPLREGEVIGVLHKTVTDWLTGEAPFDKRSSEDAFFVARDAAHRRLARACARAIRAEGLDTESYSSDAAADVVLASFVEGDGGVASDAYALRWCLFHMKRSSSEGEAIAVACALSYVQKRVEAGDIGAFAGDLDVIEGRDALLLRDALVLSRRALSQGAVLVEQLWQRLTPRADTESSPAARRLADDAKRAASKQSLLAVRPMLTAAGGAERCRIEVGSEVLAVATFVDPATGEPRVACASGNKVEIYDPVAGGAALVVIDVGSRVYALAVFKDPATGELRLACGWRKVRIYDPVAGGEALLVLEVGSRVKALALFVDPATGVLRLACGCGSGDGGAAGRDRTGSALLVIDVGERVLALAFFVDPATGAPRLACGTGKWDQGTRSDIGDVRVFDAVAGGEALVVLDGHTDYVRALAFFFADPATGELRLVSGSDDKTVRVFDPVASGQALVVIDVGSDVNALAFFADPATGEPRLATSSGQVFDPIAGGDALVVLEGGGSPLVVFTDPATGGLRLASGSNESVRVWDLAAGAALFVLEGHTSAVFALTAYADPATGEPRLASGSWDKTLRVWDASKGGAALRMVAFDDEVRALAVSSDMSGLFVTFGKRWGEFRIESGTTPLTLACYKGDVAAISDLLQKGAGVDQQDDDGYTPLFVASLKGHVDAARLLLDAGATVDKRREGDWSPFGIASVRGHVDVATLLVDRGAAVDMCLDGTTPLLVASRNQNLDGAFTVPDDTKKRAVWLWDKETVAKALEEAELDVSAPNRNGRDILLGGGGDDWTEDESDKVMEEFHRVALKFMQDQARAGDGAFTVPDDTKRRAVWLWDEETVAEVLEELEDDMEGSAPELNGKQLLLGGGDWAEGDSDKVMEMIRRCAILFMQDMAMRDDDD
ncbi:unnamed protein product [Pelagomonas calceolata]|uniref:Uncharacterized protein n=1 Tax=Pelagomonas calceolata TaxID=35677 RepID=A0A8J2T118_9STRA|nr:unnamed protein product [Pelagomonas calceolata]